MEQFVKMLYDRLETNKDLQMQLYVDNTKGEVVNEIDTLCFSIL